MKYEQKFVRAISTRKMKNPNFYDQLNENFAIKMGLEKIPIHKVSLDNDSHVTIHDPCDMKKLFASSFDIPESDGEPMTYPYDRQKYLMEKTVLSGLNDSQMEKIREIFLEYSEAFYIPNDIFKATTMYEHSIKLKPDAHTVFVRQFRIPYAQRDELIRQVKGWERDGIIEKSTSPFNSPLLLVPKKPDEKGNKQYRVVLDYREVNKICIPQCYSLPLPDELFDLLNGSSIYSLLDIFNSYMQVNLSKSSRFITSFSALNHHYEFNRVPFGLQSSGVAWLYTIHKVLQKFITNSVFVYVDDVCLYSKSEQHHLEMIKRVLKQLIKYSIKLKPQKCKFLQKEVKYLGYKVSSKGLEVDEAKTACIFNWPQLKKR